MQAEPERPGPIECLQRGLRSLRANWPLVPVLMIQTLLTLALTLAGIFVLLSGLGVGGVAWLRSLGPNWPDRLTEDLVALVEATPPAWPSLLLPLLAASLVWTVAFCLYCYLQGGVVGVLATAESVAGAGLPGWRAFRSFSAAAFDRQGRQLFWRYFWLNHVIAGVLLVWMLLLLGLALAAVRLAVGPDPALGAALGCIGMLPLALSLVGTVLWSMLATVEAARPGCGVWRASGQALEHLRRRFLPVTALWLLAMLGSMLISALCAPLRFGAALALRGELALSWVVRASLTLGETLLTCGVLVALVAALAALLGVARPGLREEPA